MYPQTHLQNIDYISTVYLIILNPPIILGVDVCWLLNHTKYKLQAYDSKIYVWCSLFHFHLDVIKAAYENEHS